MSSEREAACEFTLRMHLCLGQRKGLEEEQVGTQTVLPEPALIGHWGQAHYVGTSALSLGAYTLTEGGRW
jgi:hypothetical protein